jgi:thioredoxin-related protein
MTRFLTLLSALFLAWPVALSAAEIGDDGLHKTPWMRDTFKDLTEDLDEANSEGKRLMVIVEQRGCIYCQKLHETVFSRDNVSAYIEEHFFVVQINLHGATEVTDFDGETLEERDMARKWGLLFTPNMLFFPAEVGAVPAPQAAVAQMPGAFGAGTVLDMLTWVVEERYLNQEEEDFQRYHARRIQERADGTFD